MFYGGDQPVPVPEKPGTHDNRLAGIDACFKALALGEEDFQILAQRGLVALGDGDDGMKLPMEFLINFELLKRPLIQADFPKVGIQPDHNGAFGKAQRQGTQAEHSIGHGLAAGDDAMEEDAVPGFGKDAENVIFLNVVIVPLWEG